MNTNIPQYQPEHPEARDVQQAPEALESSRDVRAAVQRRLDAAGTLRTDTLRRAVRADATAVLEAIDGDPQRTDAVVAQANAALEQRYGEKNNAPVVRLEAAKDGIVAIIDNQRRLPIERRQ